MRVDVLKIEGFSEALFGLGLSYGLTEDISFPDFMKDEALQEKLEKVALKLANKDGGHNKFLESIAVWLDVDAPRYWWSEVDTYRVGTTKQSSSTMHTLRNRFLTKEDFEIYPFPPTLEHINGLIKDKASITLLKAALPESFLQRRVICTNAKVLRNMIFQRKGHKLQEWLYFIDAVVVSWARKGFPVEMLAGPE